ncbi:MAG: endonuclease III [Candidatus Magasanikbacteria bacterium]|nr:endonuclease III [Candidatus Magasanikbacteria bacterium]
MQNIQHRATLVLTELKRLFPTSKTILEFSNNIELLFAVMLSAQTTDVQVNKVTKNLFQKYKTLDDYISADPIILQTDLNRVNYYKTKTTYIQKTAKILKEKYVSILPRTIEEMMGLPGVGRKTAVVVLGNAYNITAGIAVDTHVKRLSKVFGLTTHDDTQKIETDLKQLFPKEEWFLLTNRMIEYGRAYCPAHCRHEKCPILAELNNLT